MKIEIQLSLSSTTLGVYSSVQPDADTRTYLKRLLDCVASIDPVKASSLHSTVLYSKNLNGVTEKPDLSTTSFTARIREFAVWVGHDGLHYLVMLLDSPELARAHQDWKDLGYTEDFDSYSPHMTFKTNFVHPRPLEITTILNNVALVSPTTLVFGQQLVKPLKGES